VTQIPNRIAELAGQLLVNYMGVPVESVANEIFVGLGLVIIPVPIMKILAMGLAVLFTIIQKVIVPIFALPVAVSPHIPAAETRA
jgi:hypothetical protein